MNKSETLIQRLEDRRSKKVVFLAHCLLNENTRYMGGACTGGCVREVIEQCLSRDVGIVQMPCPEQHAWGGVIKKLLLKAYGIKGTSVYRFHPIFVSLLLLYTKYVYSRLAKQVAGQIRDYLDSGFSVIGIIGVDASPSCGVTKTLDLWRSFDLIAGVDVESVTLTPINAIIRQSQESGSGLFVAALRKELKRKHIDVPFLAHDLLAELEGKRSNIEILPP